MDRSGPVVLVWITHFKVSRQATFLVTCLNFSGRFRSPNANVERSHAEMRNQLVVRCRRPSSRGRPKATPSLLLLAQPSPAMLNMWLTVSFTTHGRSTPSKTYYSFFSPLSSPLLSFPSLSSLFPFSFSPIISLREIPGGGGAAELRE